ncbi:GrpE-domain-containing protein [Kockovaella imperatae]|uniref:GrpE protein homolog, mitochondrial n=1 Tax=Kockovaella imperatae TaxID=4999 RepID=A0A1Y1UC88_9TREE|nr:GrpE-domain-containing protein [Kockovaella imperatae]ORX34695.1 GrpE-domain-containing protein [Kockovaella imperatae]
MRTSALRSTLGTTLSRSPIVSSRAAIPLPPRPSSLLANRLPRSYSTASSESSTSKPEQSEDAKKQSADSQGKLQEAEAKVVELQAKMDEMKSDSLYRQAEIQTLTRRIGEEKAKASEFAITSFARGLLSTTDILTTALNHVPKPIEPGTPLADLFNGVTMTQKAMYKTFEEHGMKKMAVERGTVFDPNLHEATFHIPPTVAGERGDGKTWGKGEVVEVTKEGWTIGSRVLRPAQVGITQLE